MAAAHSTLKAGSGRNPPLKRPRTPKSANRSKTAATGRKTPSAPTPPAQGPITTRKPGSEVAVRGVRIRVRGHLRDMIQAELGNLGRLESVLRCLAHSMEYQSSDDHELPLLSGYSRGSVRSAQAVAGGPGRSVRWLYPESPISRAQNRVVVAPTLCAAGLF